MLTTTWQAGQSGHPDEHNRIAAIVNGQGADVRHYGAIGDGLSDDTAAVRAAVNASQTVYLPNGHYMLTDSIVLPAGTKVICDYNAWIIAPPKLDKHLTIFLPDNDCDLQINYDGGENDFSIHDIYPIQVWRNTGINIHDCRLKNFSRIDLEGCHWGRFERNRIENAVYGFLCRPLDYGIRHNIFGGNMIRNVRDYAICLGVNIELADAVCHNQIINNQIQDTQRANTGPALGCEGASDFGQIHHNTISENIIEQSETEGGYRAGGISLGAYSESAIIKDNQISGIAKSWFGIYAEIVKDAIISDNQISGFTYGGINAHGGNGNRITGNLIINCGGDLPGGAGIALNNGNEAEGTLTSVDVDVVGNRIYFYRDARYQYAPNGIGLLKGASDTRLTIALNHITNAPARAIVINGMTGQEIGNLMISINQIYNAIDYAIDVHGTDELTRKIVDNMLSECQYDIKL